MEDYEGQNEFRDWVMSNVLGKSIIEISVIDLETVAKDRKTWYMNRDLARYILHFENPSINDFVTEMSDRDLEEVVLAQENALEEESDDKFEYIKDHEYICFVILMMRLEEMHLEAGSEMAIDSALSLRDIFTEEYLIRCGDIPRMEDRVYTLMPKSYTEPSKTA